MKLPPIRRYFIAGLLVWLPILATLIVLRFIVSLLNVSMTLIPHSLQPQALIGHNIPGIGVIISIVVLLLTGIIATNFLGKRLVTFGESVLSRIPLVRTIYNAVKQVLETIFSSGSDSFRKVLLIEYPRQGLWSIAFQTSGQRTRVVDHLDEEMLTVFVPTTPNPTSGFLMIVPRKDVTELDMSIDEALKMVISLGVVQPPTNIT